MQIVERKKTMKSVKQRYKYRWMYLAFAVVFFCLSTYQFYLNISGTPQTFIPLAYIFALCWLGLGIREVYWFFLDKR